MCSYQTHTKSLSLRVAIFVSSATYKIISEELCVIQSLGLLFTRKTFQIQELLRRKSLNCNTFCTIQKDYVAKKIGSVLMIRFNSWETPIQTTVGVIKLIIFFTNCCDCCNSVLLGCLFSVLKCKHTYLSLVHHYYKDGRKGEVKQSFSFYISFFFSSLKKNSQVPIMLYFKTFFSVIKMAKQH